MATIELRDGMQFKKTADCTKTVFTLRERGGGWTYSWRDGNLVMWDFLEPYDTSAVLELLLNGTWRLLDAPARYQCDACRAPEGAYCAYSCERLAASLVCTWWFARNEENPVERQIHQATGGSRARVTFKTKDRHGLENYIDVLTQDLFRDYIEMKNSRGCTMAGCKRIIDLAQEGATEIECRECRSNPPVRFILRGRVTTPQAYVTASGITWGLDESTTAIAIADRICTGRVGWRSGGDRSSFLTHVVEGPPGATLTITPDCGVTVEMACEKWTPSASRAIDGQDGDAWRVIGKPETAPIEWSVKAGQHMRQISDVWKDNAPWPGCSTEIVYGAGQVGTTVELTDTLVPDYERQTASWSRLQPPRHAVRTVRFIVRGEVDSRGSLCVNGIDLAIGGISGEVTALDVAKRVCSGRDGWRMAHDGQSPLRAGVDAPLGSTLVVTPGCGITVTGEQAPSAPGAAETKPLAKQYERVNKAPPLEIRSVVPARNVDRFCPALLAAAKRFELDPAPLSVAHGARFVRHLRDVETAMRVALEQSSPNFVAHNYGTLDALSRAACYEATRANPVPESESGPWLDEAERDLARIHRLLKAAK